MQQWCEILFDFDGCTVGEVPECPESGLYFNISRVHVPASSCVLQITLFWSNVSSHLSFFTSL